MRKTSCDNREKTPSTGLAKITDEFINLYQDDCNSMGLLEKKLRDRMARLELGKIYSRENCALVLDVARSLRDFNNSIYMYNDFPNEFYGTPYAERILKTGEYLAQLSYRKSSPGVFIDQILPEWKNKCGSEAKEIQEVLNSFL